MAFRFCPLSSGSSGNSVFIETDRTRILIDAGYSGKQIESLLKKIGVLPESLDAILVTHEHSDHIQGVGVLSRRYNLPVIANEKTWIAMDKKLGKIDQGNILIFKNDVDFTLRDMDIHPMSTFHDSAQGCSYIVHNKNKKISVLTDTGFVNGKMRKAIAGSDVYYIESNHDVEMLKNGSYTYSLKQRILSINGHLSNVDCGVVLGDVLVGKEEKVILAHLSSENNKPELAFQEVNGYLTGLGLDTSRDIKLSVANRYEPSEIIELEP